MLFRSQRDKERETKRETKKETKRETDKQRQTRRDRETDRESERDRQTETDTKRQRDRERDRQTDRQTNRERETERDIPAVGVVEVREEEDSTDEKSDQHSSPIHFMQESVLLFVLRTGEGQERGQRERMRQRGTRRQVQFGEKQRES